jgi:hypothetical protein
LLKFNLESWSAIAPGIVTAESWSDWFNASSSEAFNHAQLDIKQVPAMLRRRFKLLGKVASMAVLDVQNEGECIPSIFASRHGDTELTLSLLQDIAKQEPLSPTGFSLAVHNAIGGLLSIVRQDTSPMTAIASMDGLVVNALFELQAQLQQYKRVLCVIYDVPLPSLYQPYAPSLPFPLAIAFIVNRANTGLKLTMHLDVASTDVDQVDADMLTFVRLLCGSNDAIALTANKQHWNLAMAVTSAE